MIRPTGVTTTSLYAVRVIWGFASLSWTIHATRGPPPADALEGPERVAIQRAGRGSEIPQAEGLLDGAQCPVMVPDRGDGAGSRRVVRGRRAPCAVADRAAAGTPTPGQDRDGGGQVAAET